MGVGVKNADTGGWERQKTNAAPQGHSAPTGPQRPRGPGTGPHGRALRPVTASGHAGCLLDQLLQTELPRQEAQPRLSSPGEVCCIASLNS